MMRSRLSVLAGLLIVLMGYAPVSVAQSVQVEASVDAHTIGMQDEVTYAIRIQGADLESISTPEPPATTNLVLASATPSTRQYTTEVEGELQRVVLFSWQFRPLRQGDAQLHPVTLEVGGRPLTTGAIAIEAVPQSERTVPPSGAPYDIDEAPQPDDGSLISSDDLFIEVVPTEAETFVHEQVSLEYRLYYRPGIRLRQSRLARAWDAPGFWREDLNVEGGPHPDDPHAAYRYIVIKRVAAFPTRTGTLTVAPLQVDTEANPGVRLTPSDRLATGRRTFEEVHLASQEVTVTANPLPDHAPDRFDDAVGTFNWERSTIPERVAVGDALTFSVTIEGTGNLYAIDPPELAVSDHVEVYTPDTETNLNRDGDRLAGTRTFTYTLVPRAEAPFTIEGMTWSYFDPEEGAYYTHTEDAVEVDVTAAESTLANKQANAPSERTSEARESASAERPWPSLLVGLGLLGLVAASGWAYWVWGGLLVGAASTRSDTDRSLSAATAPDAEPAEHEATDHADQAALTAMKQAQRHLDTAQHHLRTGPPADFYAALEQAVVGFVGQRLNRSPNGLTHAEIDHLLQAYDVEVDVCETAQELLHACDQAQYSPSHPSHDSMLAALDAAHTLLIRLDATLPAASSVASSQASAPSG